MKRWARAGIATATILSMTHGALAGEDCVRHDEMTALKAAAVQQQLMVAALSCHATSLYNRFVLSYRRELQASDDALKAFFQRRTGAEAEYNAFKTRLANASSLSSIGHTGAYCEDAYAGYDAALSAGPRSLEELVNAQPVSSLDLNYSECNDGPLLFARNERRTDRGERGVERIERRRAAAAKMQDNSPLVPQDHELPPDKPAY